ncbi:histidine phosphatase family protein [Psychromonas sp. PT13]|uniref:histidine phosphatase family protein n=1 Tax=Psychromonas sp. PT13 TaxID=3439547 RepID=UPI003EB72A44
MDIIFVRHGVPDYTLADSRKMTQLEKDYAPLNRDYINDIHVTANQIKQLKPDVIISSPYTRALQTAELINRELQLELYVEHDLREWRADLTGGFLPLAERDNRWFAYRDALKEGKPQTDTSYESTKVLKERVLKVLGKYKGYSKVVIVSHFNVLESLIGYQDKELECGQFRSLILAIRGE